jgi:preprotein translocase subunit YajC
MIIMIVVVVIAMYFLMIRPSKKQQQKQQDLMNSLAVGSRVMLNSGIYGTIRHLGEKQAIVEISPGVDLTIIRRAIVKVATPDEEEFEYAEAADNANTSASDPLPEDWPVLDEAQTTGGDAPVTPASPADPPAEASASTAGAVPDEAWAQPDTSSDEPGHSGAASDR